MKIESPQELQLAMGESGIINLLKNSLIPSNHVIALNDEKNSVDKVIEEEKEGSQNMLFSNQDCAQLKRFMEAEPDFRHKPKCQKCKKRKCEDKFSAEHSRII